MFSSHPVFLPGCVGGGLTEVILKPVKGSQTSKQPYLTTVLYPGTLLALGILRKEQTLRSLGFYSSSTQVPPSSGPQFLNCEIQQLRIWCWFSSLTFRGQGMVRQGTSEALVLSWGSAWGPGPNLSW